MALKGVLDVNLLQCILCNFKTGLIQLTFEKIEA